MKYYKIFYPNGTCETIQAKNSLEVVKKLDLATKELSSTRIIEIENDQKPIAISRSL